MSDHRSNVPEAAERAGIAFRTGRGTKRLSDESHYFAVDTTIARVDSLTGRVTAPAVGTTDVGARHPLRGRTEAN